MDESVKVLRKKHLNRGTKGKQKSAKRKKRFRQRRQSVKVSRQEKFGESKEPKRS